MSAIGGEAAAVAQMQPPPQPQRQACAFSPASVGNVAVGFDILGHPLAGVGDTVTVRRIDAPQVRVAAIRGAPFALPLEAERNTAGAALIGCEDEKVALVDPHLTAAPESIDLGDVVGVVPSDDVVHIEDVGASVNRLPSEHAAVGA